MTETHTETNIELYSDTHLEGEININENDMATNTHNETQELVEAGGHASANADEGLAASLGINAQLFGFQLLNFAIVAGIVWFLILKPLTKTLEERKKMIDDSIDNAKAVETNLQMSEQKYQEKLDEAKVEANKVIERAHSEAEKLSVDMKEKAKKEIELLVTQAKKNINIEKEEVMDGIKKETAGLIVAAVEKIINERLDEKKDKALIEETLKKLQK